MCVCVNVCNVATLSSGFGQVRYDTRFLSNMKPSQRRLLPPKEIFCSAFGRIMASECALKSNGQTILGEPSISVLSRDPSFQETMKNQRKQLVLKRTMVETNRQGITPILALPQKFATSRGNNLVKMVGISKAEGEVGNCI